MRYRIRVISKYLDDPIYLEIKLSILINVLDTIPVIEKLFFFQPSVVV